MYALSEVCVERHRTLNWEEFFDHAGPSLLNKYFFLPQVILFDVFFF